MKFAPTILAIAWTSLVGIIGITNTKAETYLLNRHPSQGQLIEPGMQPRNDFHDKGGQDLGYPLNSEDLKYAQSKEYQESLKHQTEHDENTNSDMFEGDIALDNDAKMILQERGVLGLRKVVNGKKWPKVNGLVMVPYRLASGFTEQQRADIQLAVEEFRQKSCVRLVPVTNTEEPFVQVNPHPASCYVENLGMVRPGQVMGLATWCRMGNIVHEFMHSLGHFHEHTRSDRDNYVTVDTSWIDDLHATNDNKEDFRRQYNICSNCEDQKVGYDYGSIMHYGEGSCIELIHGQQKCAISITPNQPGVRIGQRKGLSALDIESINERNDCQSPEVEGTDHQSSEGTSEEESTDHQSSEGTSEEESTDHQSSEGTSEEEGTEGTLWPFRPLPSPFFPFALPSMLRPGVARPIFPWLESNGHIRKWKSSEEVHQKVPQAG